MVLANMNMVHSKKLSHLYIYKNFTCTYLSSASD